MKLGSKKNKQHSGLKKKEMKMNNMRQLNKTPKPFVKWAGWKSTLKPLREYFDKADYLLNLEMLRNGF